MFSKNRLTAIFENEVDAREALYNLEHKGYSREEITLLMSKKTFDEKHMHFMVKTKVPEGATVGAGLGGLAGALAGALVAIGSATLTGGLGLFAAGPIVAALAGAGVGTAAGGMIGGLLGLGFSEKEARHIDEKLSNGHVVIDIVLKDHDPTELKRELEEKHNSEVIYFQ